MGLGDVANKVISKPVLLSPARNGGTIQVRYFIPHTRHKSLAITESIGISTATLIEGSVAAKIVTDRPKGLFTSSAQKLCDIYSSIGCALSSFRPRLGPPFDFLFDTCSCQTARCFNKSKGVLINSPKLKAFRNPQPSWGFSMQKKPARVSRWLIIPLNGIQNA